MNPLAWCEAIAYAIARGAVRAWLDVMQQRSTAIDEVPTNADRDRAILMRNAVVTAERVLDAPAHGDTPQFSSPP